MNKQRILRQLKTRTVEELPMTMENETQISFFIKIDAENIKEILPIIQPGISLTIFFNPSNSSNSSNKKQCDIGISVLKNDHVEIALEALKSIYYQTKHLQKTLFKNEQNFLKMLENDFIEQQNKQINSIDSLNGETNSWKQIIFPSVIEKTIIDIDSPLIIKIEKERTHQQIKKYKKEFIICKKHYLKTN